MITKVVINNNGDTPIEYLSGLGAFKNGKTYEFKPGVNIIVGKNGCGKTTLMNLIRKYLLVDLSECSAGAFNHNINAICFGLGFAVAAMMFADGEKLKQRMKELEEEKPYAEEIRRADEEFDREIIRLSGFEW